jgi:hypothetical protein
MQGLRAPVLRAPGERRPRGRPGLSQRGRAPTGAVRPRPGRHPRARPAAAPHRPLAVRPRPAGRPGRARRRAAPRTPAARPGPRRVARPGRRSQASAAIATTVLPLATIAAPTAAASRVRMVERTAPPGVDFPEYPLSAVFVSTCSGVLSELIGVCRITAARERGVSDARVRVVARRGQPSGGPTRVVVGGPGHRGRPPSVHPDAVSSASAKPVPATPRPARAATSRSPAVPP